MTPLGTLLRPALVAACATALAAAGSVVAAGPAAAGPPASWRWWDGAAYQLTHGLSSWPGLGDDACRPSAAHPEPVVLVHGTGLNGGNSWAGIGGELVDRGHCVWAPTIGAPPGAGSTGGLDSLTAASAPQLAAEIDRVRELTGAPRVALVGHSQGSVVAAYTAKALRPGAVSRVVTLGVDPGRLGAGPPPEVGAAIGVLSSDTAARDLEATAAWLGDENLPFARGVAYTAVVSDADELTGPVREVSVPAGIDLRVVRLQDGCARDRSGHLTVLADPRAADLVANALTPGRPTEPRCVAADGLVGVREPVPPRNVR